MVLYSVLSTLNIMELTAKERAKELYTKVEFEIKYNAQPSTVHQICKTLAVKMVQEIVTELNKVPNVDLSDLQYWCEVECEIDLL
jgi:predicted Zn-ribbon and HTH transcriptional regulator